MCGDNGWSEKPACHGKYFLFRCSFFIINKICLKYSIFNKFELSIIILKEQLFTSMCLLLIQCKLEEEGVLKPKDNNLSDKLAFPVSHIYHRYVNKV